MICLFHTKRENFSMMREKTNTAPGFANRSGSIHFLPISLFFSPAGLFPSLFLLMPLRNEFRHLGRSILLVKNYDIEKRLCREKLRRPISVFSKYVHLDFHRRGKSAIDMGEELYDLADF